MGFFEKEYDVKCRNGKRYLVTAEQLYEQVLKDSRSDYNWTVSAKELVRVSRETDFPEMYAVAIKILVLNCFANLEVQKESFVTISDFEQLRKDLDADFNKMVKTAEEEGAFEEDDQKQRERMRKFWSSINLKDM